MNFQDIIIAIDGPSASGKTSLGKAIASHYQFTFLDSGKLYRLFTYFLLTEKKISPDELKDEQKLKKNAKFFFENLNIENLETINLHTQIIEENLHLVVNFPWLRKEIVKFCRQFGKENNLVIIGRDASTVIFPEAKLKFFLTSELKIRAKRKYQVLEKTDPDIFLKNNHADILKKIEKDLKKRDANDKNRTFGKLKIAAGAILFDNSRLTLEETISDIIKKIDSKLKEVPKIVLFGQSNVGKSTLFNSLINQKRAITSKELNTTRDIYRQPLFWEDKKVELIDTGGFLDFKPGTNLEKEIIKKTKKLISQSDCLVWVLDYHKEISDWDYLFQKNLKKFKEKTIIVINKFERKIELFEEFKWKKLGIKTIIPVSAIQKKNLDSLKSKIFAKIKNFQEEAKEERKLLKIAILGQPNAGKSTFFNRLVRENLAIVDSTPHTTTNINEKMVPYENYLLNFIDTAGLRRKQSKVSLIEKKSKTQIKKILNETDLILLMFDLTKNITVQDRKIVNFIQKVKPDLPFLICANKKDLIENHLKFFLNDALFNLPNIKKKTIIAMSQTQKKPDINYILKEIIKRINSKNN